MLSVYANPRFDDFRSGYSGSKRPASVPQPRHVAHAASAPPTNPLLRCADRYECVLQPGECLFVPAGCAHAVRNLDHTLAISANFVDASNLGLVRDELAVAALRSPEAAALPEQLSAPAFDATMDFARGDVPWAEFKRPPGCPHDA